MKGSRELQWCAAGVEHSQLLLQSTTVQQGDLQAECQARPLSGRLRVASGRARWDSCSGSSTASHQLAMALPASSAGLRHPPPSQAGTGGATAPAWHRSTPAVMCNCCSPRLPPSTPCYEQSRAGPAAQQQACSGAGQGQQQVCAGAGQGQRSVHPALLAGAAHAPKSP